MASGEEGVVAEVIARMAAGMRLSDAEGYEDLLREQWPHVVEFVAGWLEDVATRPVGCLVPFAAGKLVEEWREAMADMTSEREAVTGVGVLLRDGVSGAWWKVELDDIPEESGLREGDSVDLTIRKRERGMKRMRSDDRA